MDERRSRAPIIDDSTSPRLSTLKLPFRNSFTVELSLAFSLMWNGLNNVLLKAVVSVPTGDMQQTRPVNAAAGAHFVFELRPALSRQPTFDDGEMAVGKIRKRGARATEVIGTETGVIALHGRGSHRNDRGKPAGTCVVMVASATSKPWRASASKCATVIALRSVGYFSAEAACSSVRKAS
jgi:hypothetical protein